MADTIVVKELLVSLGVDSEEADKALADFDQKTDATAKKADLNFKEIGKSAVKGFTVITGAATAAATAIFGLVNSVTAAADATAKGARASGLGAEEYQRLAFAAERSGTNIETVGKVNRFVQKSFLDAAGAKGMTPFTQGLKDIGLGIEDIKGLGFEEQLGVIGEALQGVSNESERTALAARILGEEGGPQLASLLAEGTDGIMALGDQAERTGAVLSEDALASSEAFQDSLTNAKATIGGVVNTLGVEFLPMVQEVVEEVGEWVQENRELIRERLAEFLTGVASAGKVLLPVIVDIVSAVVSFFEAVSDGPEQVAALTSAFAALGFAIGGVPGLVVAAGVALGSFLADTAAEVTGLEESIRSLRQERERTQRSTKLLEAGTSATERATGLLRASPEDLAALSDEEVGTLFEEALRGARESGVEGGEATIVRVFGSINERRNAEVAKQDRIKQSEARRQRLDKERRESQQRQDAFFGKSARGGGGGGRPKPPADKKTSLKTAVSPFLGARGRAGSLPGVSLSAAPTVAVSIFNVNVQAPITVDGAGDPGAVARLVVGELSGAVQKAAQDLKSTLVR